MPQASKSISPLPSSKSGRPPGHPLQIMGSWMVMGPPQKNSRQVSTKMKSFLFFLNSVGSGVFSHVVLKVLRQTDMFVFWRSLGANGFCLPKTSWEGSPKFYPLVLWGNGPEKVPWRVAPTVPYIYICLPVSFWVQSYVNCRHVSHIHFHLQKTINHVVRC